MPKPCKQVSNLLLLFVSLDQFPPAVAAAFQYLHLPDGDPVEPDETLALRYALLDEYGIEVFHIREAYQLVDRGIVADVPFPPGSGSA